TDQTLTDPETFEQDLAAGRKLGMQIETNQFRPGVACAAVAVVDTGDLAERTVLGCALPTRDFMHSAREVRTRLRAYGQMLYGVITGGAPAAACTGEGPGAW